MSVLSIEEGTRVYAELKAEVIAAGILEKSYTFYTFLIILMFGGFFASLGAIYVLEGYGWLALACLAFSFFSVQVAGINHDAGHRAVFRSTRLNNVLGLLSCSLLGIVFDNWRARHNAHHAFSNTLGKDPDLEVPFLAADPSLLAGKGGLQRALIPFQHFYYYPLGSIVSFSNRLGTASYFLRRRRLADAGRLALYLPPIFVLFVLPFLIFPLEKALFVFAIVHVSSGIYLANCFAPNHKGMDVIDPKTPVSYIEKEIRTSRNVRGNLLIDTLLVGLNYQVEHHLFPSCPRNKLRHIRPYLDRVCERHGIPFVEAGLIETNLDILRSLRAVARGIERKPASLREEMIETANP